MPVRRHNVRVPALRVLRVHDAAVPGPRAGGEHEHLLAVQVHGVREGDVVVEDDADAGVGGEVVSVGFGGGGDALGGEAEEGGVEVAAEAGGRGWG